MKLDKEHLQKIFLAGAVLLLLLYGYFAYLLGPLQDGARGAANGITTIIPQISDAKAQIAKAAALEQQAPVATRFLENLKATIPDGAPIAWFPPKMADFFKSHGIEKCTTHLVSDGGEVMPGFKKMVWLVDLPKVEFVPLGIAISDLENGEPLLNILNVTVDATREDAQYQHATLTLSTLVKS